MSLLPLLGSIGRELEERGRTLAELEASIERLSNEADSNRVRMHALVADASAQRRGIRLAHRELDQLGCRILGTDPLTFRIPGKVGESEKSFVWQSGDPILK